MCSVNPLNKEEETWFEIYHDIVRPLLVKANKKIGNFFISTSRERLHNVSTNLARLHTKFGLKPVTSQAVRRMSEAYVSSNCMKTIETQLFSKYQAHSNDPAECVYREKTMNNMIKASSLPDRIQELQEQPSTSKAAMEENLKMGRAQDQKPPVIWSGLRRKHLKGLLKSIPSLWRRIYQHLKDAMQCPQSMDNVCMIGGGNCRTECELST
ncbi:uncharacterized protein LOC142671115 isoform X2 [Rhinoderma darwinii]|uniref:uncharacterized protein LOC142671115 isoform X2 n=1 Tax=Rhinoderma darwinii TaxID=43563 RepID=UPI003F66B375